MRERIRYEPLGGAGAPVISDEGTWGTPSPQYHTAAPERGAETRAWLTLALTAVAAFWLGAFSMFQMTSRAVAVPVAERGLAAIAEVDALLALHADALCDRAGTGEPVQVEGFPVHDIPLRGTELTCTNGELDHPALRSLLLERGAERIYLRGDDAFTDPGQTADSASPFSGAGFIRGMLSTLTTGTHEIATIGAAALGGVALLLAVALVAAGGRRRRTVRLGAALMLSALPIVGGALGLRLLFGVFGGGAANEAMLGEFVAIAKDLTWLPLRNALIVAGCGLALVLPVVFSRRRAGE